MTKIEICPQEGPQTEFLSTKADIAIYGGSAGGGKSYGLLLEALRNYENSTFNSVIFRRTSTQVRNPGGLWDESVGMYSVVGARPYESALEWTFPSGASIKFAHLEHEKSVYDWQGSQIAYIGFDELTHFTEKQFWYMLSRNRSVGRVRPYIRATTNPDVDSWVRKLIDWWIGADGLPIKERSGKIRWFIRQNDNIIWGDSKKELTEKYGADSLPKSLTFIPSKLQDNKILMEKDPGYLANLNALSRVDRMRLKDGNWNVRPSAGMYFRREWMKVIDVLPAGHSSAIRYWDKASTEPNEENKDPDWTRGLKLYTYPNGIRVVADLRSLRESPLKVEQAVLNTASSDGHEVRQVIEKDPGSAGAADADNYVRMLAGYDVGVNKPTKDKETRARPVSAQCEAGNIQVLRAAWNEEFFNELENFPEGSHDDIVDVLSGAFNESCNGASILDVL